MQDAAGSEWRRGTLMPRCFIAVAVDHQLGLELIGLRDRAMDHLRAARPRAVPAGNFHLTLAFLGELPEARLAALQSCIDGLVQAEQPGNIALTHASCFPDAKSRVFAAQGEADPSASRLYRHLRTALADKGFLMAHQEFRPHITLARLAHSFVPAPRWPLALALPVDGLALYESVQRQGEVRYRLLRRWELIVAEH